VENKGGSSKVGFFGKKEKMPKEYREVKIHFKNV